MRGFILAAGLGTRLRPLTNTLPKPLVPVAGVPLLERALRQFAAAGVTEVAVNAYHLADQIVAFVGDGQRFGLHAKVFVEAPEVLGTGGGLRNAAAFLRAGGPAFLLANGDVWHNFDLAALQRAHLPAALGTLAMAEEPRRPALHTVSCAGSHHTGASGRITRIGRTHAGPGGDFAAIYSGVAVLASLLLDQLPEGESSVVEHGFWPAMAQGAELRWWLPGGHWYDCGTHAEVLRSSAHALRERAETLRASAHALGERAETLRERA